MLRVLAVLAVLAVVDADADAAPVAPAPAAGAPRALSYSITMQGRRAGEVELRIAADGSRTGDLRFTVRGAVETIHTQLTVDAAGAPRRFRATGRDHFGQPIDEQL